jgi:hypothetical protein
MEEIGLRPAWAPLELEDKKTRHAPIRAALQIRMIEQDWLILRTPEKAKQKKQEDKEEDAHQEETNAANAKQERKAPKQS